MNIKWFYCEYAKNQPRVNILICAANCKVPKKFGRCKCYEANEPAYAEECPEENSDNGGGAEE
jgi:hypothetical protein